MTRYVVRYHAGVVGTDVAVLTDEDEFDSADEAVKAYVCEGWDWYWSFNDEDDEIDPELDIWVEEYDPETHDGIL